MNFRNILIGAVSAAAVAAIAGSASAQATSSVGVNAKIIQPLTVTGDTANPMNFGTIIKTGTGAKTVVVKTDGTRDSAGTATVVTTSTTHQASFTIGGENNQTFTIGLATSGLPSGVTLGSYTLAGCGTSLTAATISASNTCTAAIGGTLSIADIATVTTGAVAGTLTATVTYN